MALAKYQLAFAKAVALNGGDKVAAFKVPGWKCDGYTAAALAVQADKEFNHRKATLGVAKGNNRGGRRC